MSDENEAVAVTEPTYQQQLVVKCLNQLFEATRKASESNDRRAEKIAAVAGGIVAFLGGASAFGTADFRADPLSGVALIGVFGLAISVFYHCARVWRPVATMLPASTDPDELYQDYIARDVYGAYNQHLTSLTSCAEQNRQAAELKAQRIDWAMVLVQWQVVAVTLFVVFRAIGW